MTTHSGRVVDLPNPAQLHEWAMSSHPPSPEDEGSGQRDARFPHFTTTTTSISTSTTRPTTAKKHSMSTPTEIVDTRVGDADQQVPGAYPQGADIGQRDIAQEAKKAVKDLQDAAKRAEERVMRFVPHEVAETLGHTMPKEHHHTEVDSKWELPTTEQPSGARQGVRSLPGQNHEHGVAKLPEERAKDGTLFETHSALHTPVELPSKEVPSVSHHVGVGSLPGKRNEAGVAKLPDTRPGSPTNLKKKYHKKPTKATIASTKAIPASTKGHSATMKATSGHSNNPFLEPNDGEPLPAFETVHGGRNGATIYSTTGEGRQQQQQQAHSVRDAYHAGKNDKTTQTQQVHDAHQKQTCSAQQKKAHERKENSKADADSKMRDALGLGYQRLSSTAPSSRERESSYRTDKAATSISKDTAKSPGGIIQKAEEKAEEVFNTARDAMQDAADKARMYAPGTFGAYLGGDNTFSDRTATKTGGGKQAGGLSVIRPQHPMGQRHPQGASVAQDRRSPPELPTREHPGLPHHFGVGSLPGPNTEEGVAMTPEEWKHEEMPSTEIPSRPHHFGVGSLPGPNTEERVAMTPDEWKHEEMPSTETPSGPHHFGVGSLPGRNTEVAVAVLPDEKKTGAGKQAGQPQPFTQTKTWPPDMPTSLKSEYFRSPLEATTKADEEAIVTDREEGTLPGYPSHAQMATMVEERIYDDHTRATRAEDPIHTTSNTLRGVPHLSPQAAASGHISRGDTPFASQVGDAPRAGAKGAASSAGYTKSMGAQPGGGKFGGPQQKQGKGIGVQDLGKPIQEDEITATMKFRTSGIN